VCACHIAASPPRTPRAYGSQMRANVRPKDPTRGQCQGKRPHGRSDGLEPALPIRVSTTIDVTTVDAMNRIILLRNPDLKMSLVQKPIMRRRTFRTRPEIPNIEIRYNSLPTIRICRSLPLPSVDPITNATSKSRSLDPGRIRPSPLQRDVGGS